MKNLHQAYYKDYFKGLDFRYLVDDNIIEPTAKIKQRNEMLTSPNLLKVMDKHSIINQEIPLQISYPGLVTGIGINHEAKIEGEFKLGVHFDWTYGMPVIYGSSVKGVLRSAFNDGYVDTNMIKKINEKRTEKLPDWIGIEGYRQTIIDNVFECKGKSIYDRDIFFDAVIVKPDTKGRILCSDSITPHGDNPLKNPTPITFLKIAPGCTIQFRFKLVPTKIKSTDGTELTFSETDKKAIFKEILTTVGIGAKTNVGYGQLVEPSNNSGGR